MRLIVLGAGAGGGLPQWNCACRNCRDARDGRLPPMTQSSVAVSPDGRAWVLLNASPDIRAQLAGTPALHPPELRGSPVQSVIVTNADVDHVAGLLTLREKTGFTLYASAAAHSVLAGNPVFDVLDPSLVERRAISLEVPFEPVSGLAVTAFAVPGKVALYLEEGEPDTAMMGEQTIGLWITDGARAVAYVPGCAEVTDELLTRLEAADLILFDGTVWSDDEMPGSGTGAKTGARMGHVAMEGPRGSLVRMAGLKRPRKVYIHINNTNPVLQPGGPERARAEAGGWTFAADGMEISP